MAGADLADLVACSNDRLLALARALLGNGLICVALIRANGEVGYVSEVGRVAFEIDDTATLIGRDWLTLWPATERVKVVRAIAEVQAGRTGRLRAYCPTAKGADRWWDTILIPLSPECGEAGEIMAVLSDVTAIEEAAARRAQGQRLEAIGQLTGGVAHDFNNLLTVIMGNAESLVQATAPGGESRELAEMILSAASKGANLVSRLLAFSRRGALEPATVDLGELIVALCPLVRRTLGPAIRIDLSVPDDAVLSSIDRVELESALLNLCVNARDAMPLGGVLRISLEPVEVTPPRGRRLGLAEGAYARIVVADTGVGMTRRTLERSIEPFFTTKPVGKGTGLGLSSAYGFVKQSGGHLAIASTPGEGATVSLYLPLAQVAAAPTEVAA